MKRAFILILTVILLTTSFVSCALKEKGDKLKIVATIFPIYDWAREIAGDNADIELLIDSGVDLHSFQPTFDDVVTISDCDVFICVGGESDAWVSKALEQATNKDMKVINLMELLGDKAKTEDPIGEDGHEEEYDEHVWLSLGNAAFFCDKIAEAIADKDESNRDVYLKNAENYVEKIKELDLRYKKEFENKTFDEIIVCDRFPFRYLTDDYGLKYYAAFSGCSADSEASAATLINLATKADETGVKALFYLTESDGKIAKTVRDMTRTKDQELLTLDPLQAVSSDGVENGVTYLSEMEKNLETILSAVK